MQKKKIILIEILIWIVALSLFAFGGLSSLKNWAQGHKYYHVDFRDVDGMIVGSPVRFMGIDVGYIFKIQPLFDRVHLVFVLKKKIQIPKNTIATIQFTGLAGSKSLELVPQGGSNLKGRTFISIEPIRADSVFDMQNAITNAVLKNSKAMINMFGDNTPKQARKLVKKVIDDSKSYIELAEEMNQKAKDINEFFNTKVENFKKGLESGTKAIDTSNIIVTQIKTLTVTTSNIKKNYTGNKHIQFNNKLSQMNLNLSKKASILKPDINGSFIHRLLNATNDSSIKLKEFSKSIENTIDEEKLKSFEVKVRNAKNTSEKLKDSIHCSK